MGILEYLRIYVTFPRCTADINNLLTFLWLLDANFIQPSLKYQLIIRHFTISDNYIYTLKLATITKRTTGETNNHHIP